MVGECEGGLIFRFTVLNHIKCPYIRKKQSIDMFLEEAQTMDLLDKDFKSAILDMFK